MRKFKFGIPLVGSIAVLLGLPGCADESHWGNSSNEKGNISLSLTTDTGIKSAKPVFRSETDETADPNNLSTYINVPSTDDFSIKLEKSTGEVSSWKTLTDFKDHISKNQFETGTYTLTAYYGEKGTQDFEAPYFEASTTFNVISDQDNEISLTATLQNSMIKINYTDAFKNYMKDYHVKITTEGIANPIIYGALETRPLFLEPNNASLTLNFTTKGKEATQDLFIGKFPPLKKTLHNITFDLNENASTTGDATLEIRFDETLEEEPISIDLTQELLTTPAPKIECTGFENGQTLDMLESGNIPEIKMTTTSSDQIATAIFTIESSNYNPSWGKEIDLCKATPEQQTAIKNAGIEAIGFGFGGSATDLIAILDLTKFGKELVKGNHTVSLIVKDVKGKTSQVASVTFDNQEVILVPKGNATFAYGAEQGELTFDFNGSNPLENLIFYVDGQLVNTISCFEPSTATRAAEKKTYVFTIPINNPIKKTVEIRASYNGKTNFGPFTIPVNIPEYRIEAYDAFSRYAYAKITTTDNSVLSTVTQNIELKDLNIAARDTQNGIITISGLTAATTYSVKSSITGDEPTDDNGIFTTETELQIPNGDFSGINVNEISFDNVQVGGQYRVSPVDYTLKSSIKRDTPADWATVNSLTAWEGSSNKNTWFVVPSTYVENQTAILKSVGYNHNGTTPAKSGGAFNTKYYCENAPADNQLEKAAGELFLGEYTFNGNESRSEGKPFASRPAEVKFDYKYKALNGDKGYVKVELLDSEDHTIGEIKEMALDESSEMKTVTIKLSYEAFGKKAAKLRVNFKSSNQTTPPINIPSGTELNENQSLGNHTLAANSYHALATGSELCIDNVIAVYEGASTSANAPKRKTIKRK